ncbi:hypothetical protein RvY_06486 [Ramazzottius varieornatus]|uniref:N-alpha-acetyltransferase 60 n=1 Tax=Ramazzottius varieornatus TaxID=947166 RepID=A0A1D1V511_RAMVA|nr:hypothetical protein RvY_06486 [Ramazzottius varieornatus]
MDDGQQFLLHTTQLDVSSSDRTVILNSPSPTPANAMNSRPPKTAPLDFKIYTPNIDDAEEIEAFCIEVFPAVYEHAWFRFMLQSDSVYKLCYRKGGKIVALIVGQVAKRESWNDVLQVSMSSDMENDTRNVTAYIMLLGVSSEHRRHGLGTRLLLSFMTMISLAFPTVSRSFFLHCAVENEAALVMYERQGFRSVRLLKNYYNYNRNETPPDHHDAFLLTKKITPVSEILDTLREGLALCFSKSAGFLKQLLARITSPVKFLLRCFRDVFSSDQMIVVGPKTQPEKIV